MRAAAVAAAAVAGLTVLALSRPAAAQPNCPQPDNQLQLNECYDKYYRALDAELNDVYRKLAARLAHDAETGALLKKAELAWIAYRDDECKFEINQSKGGSIYPMEWSNCLADKTAVHIKVLKRQLDCPEGDPTCVQ